MPNFIKTSFFAGSNLMQSNFIHKFVVTGVYLGCCRSALLTDTETLVTEWLHAKSARDVIQLRCNCYVFSFICNETIKLINIWIFFPRCNCFFIQRLIYTSSFLQFWKETYVQRKDCNNVLYILNSRPLYVEGLFDLTFVLSEQCRIEFHFLWKNCIL